MLIPSFLSKTKILHKFKVVSAPLIKARMRFPYLHNGQIVYGTINIVKKTCDIRLFGGDLLYLLIFALIIAAINDFSGSLILHKLLLLVIMILALDLFSRKLFIKGGVRKLSETDGAETMKWVEGVIGASAIFYFLLSFKPEDYVYAQWFLISFFVIRFGAQALLERKYIKGVKHLASFTLMVVSVISIYSIFFITDQMKYTTLEEVALNELNMQQIERIELTRYEDDRRGHVSRITIKDRIEIQRLLSNLSIIELKEERYRMSNLGQYAISIYYGYEPDQPYGHILTISLSENNEIRLDGGQILPVRNRGIYSYDIINENLNLAEILDLKYEWE